MKSRLEAQRGLPVFAVGPGVCDDRNAPETNHSVRIPEYSSRCKAAAAVNALSGRSGSRAGVPDPDCIAGNSPFATPDPRLTIAYARTKP